MPDCMSFHFFYHIFKNILLDKAEGLTIFRCTSQMVFLVLVFIRKV